MKIIVYAISKNEENFVDRWYESMKEADDIYVLDTGSTDDTVKKLKSHGINVKQKEIIPWRFDVARNESLELVPLDTDVCVCTDLDEILEPGWRKKIEETWNDSNRLRYTYNWSIDKNNKPKVTFIYEKIHDRLHYKWIYPVHEVLKCNLDKEKIDTNLDIVLNHYPDLNKSRSSYLPLLELAYKENPNNDRILHYLGREYMYHKEYDKAINILIEHIYLENSKWDMEKSASMRFISRCYINLGRFDEAFMWLNKAIELTPFIREPYVERGILYFNNKEYIKGINDFIKAKSILSKELLYINEPFCYDSTIDDYLSLCFNALGLYDEAIFFVNKAIEINKDDSRLVKNLEIFTSNKKSI